MARLQRVQVGKWVLYAAGMILMKYRDGALDALSKWVKVTYGVRVLMVVVPHTFGRHLNFNAHLHVMVSAGGLKESGACWTSPVRFDRRKLMHMWRYAVITYLRAALKKGLLVSEASTEDLKVMLESQYERWWNLTR